MIIDGMHYSPNCDCENCRKISKRNNILPAKEKSYYEERVQEETEKFAKRHNLDYELVKPFADWIEWFTRQDERKRIRDLIK